MTTRTKRRIAIACIALAGIGGISQAVVVEVADRLVAPPRRTIQDYHRAWLENPEAHGIRIESFSCLGDDVPCLLVSPADSPSPSERGAIIRRQLVSRGYSLGSPGEVHGTLVLLHGRKSRKEDLLPVAERFCAAGFRCLLPDLPAHGDNGSSGVFLGAGDREGEFARLILSGATQEFDLDPLPSGIWGISMGGAFAAKALSVGSSDWDCAVIVSSFDSLDEVVREQSRRRTGVLGPVFSTALLRTLQTRHGLDSSNVTPVTWASEAHVPTLIAHGTVDSLFPLERGRALFDALPSEQKRWVEVEGGDHDNVLITPMPLYATMAGWFLDHMPTGH